MTTYIWNLTFVPDQLSDRLQHVILNAEHPTETSALQTDGAWAGCYLFRPGDVIDVQTQIGNFEGFQTVTVHSLHLVCLPNIPIATNGLSPFDPSRSCISFESDGGNSLQGNLTVPKTALDGAPYAGGWQVNGYLNLATNLIPRVLVFDPEVIVGSGTGED